MVVQQATVDESAVHASSSRLLKIFDRLALELDKFPARFYRRRLPHLFLLKRVPGAGLIRVNRHPPDIVNLHTFRSGFVSLESLKRIGCPIVWTMHDMWCFTGGCHYAGECLKYMIALRSVPGARKSTELGLVALDVAAKGACLHVLANHIRGAEPVAGGRSARKLPPRRPANRDDT